MWLFLILVKQSFWLALRDRVIATFCLAALGVIFIGSLVKNWSLQNELLIYLNICGTGFFWLGHLLAIFIGGRLLNSQDGYLDMPNTTSISRTQFVFGRMFGFVFVIILYSAVLLALLQGSMIVHQLGVLQIGQLRAFGVFTLGWCLTATMVSCLSAQLSQNVAQFSSFCLLIVGLIAHPILQALPPGTSVAVLNYTRIISKIWNLQAFNVLESFTLQTPVVTADLRWLAIYGLTLMGIFLVLASIIFARKDLVQ